MIDVPAEGDLSGDVAMGGACSAHAVLSCVPVYLRHTLFLTLGVGCLTEGEAGGRGRYTEKYGLPGGDPGGAESNVGTFSSRT